LEFTLNLASVPFDLGHTLDSGQAFRWTQKAEWWYGVVPGGALKVSQREASLVCVTGNDSGRITPQLLREYFRLDEDLERIYSRIMRDDHITEAIQRYYGLRLIQQDTWECLVSFVIATNTNIPRIKLMISRLCEKFGEKVEFERGGYSLFPTPKSLAAATREELAACGLGYRTRFVSSVAQTVSSGRVDLEELRLLEYERAREILVQRLLGEKSLLGIGRKAADCILLFSCGKDSSFPIDVWMARVLARYYPRLFEKEVADRLQSHVSSGGEGRLSAGTYEKISSSMRDYFGEYAGYAQQYLFHDARKGKLE
jgi:N-glycosylase/DNA lyase